MCNCADTKNAVRQAVDSEMTTVAADAASVMGGGGRKNTPAAADDDSERTTASIASDRSMKHGDDDDDNRTEMAANGRPADGLVAVENGRMKRFMRDMRTKRRGMSCRNADTEVVDDGERTA